MTVWLLEIVNQSDDEESKSRKLARIPWRVVAQRGHKQPLRHIYLLLFKIFIRFISQVNSLLSACWHL